MRRALAIFFAALAVLPAARAQEKKEIPKPEIKGTSLLALPVGKTATVILYGENLTPRSVEVKPPLTAGLGEIKDTDEATKKARGAARQVAVEVQVPANAPPGVYELTLAQEGDAKAVARIAVVEAAPAEVEAKRPNATFAQAMPLPGPFVAVTGALGNDTADVFRFEARAGETWEITLLAGRAGSPLDPLLRVRDERHAPLALSAGDSGRDRRITFQAPRDGAYYIELTDSEGKGGPNYLYRLVVRRGR